MKESIFVVLIKAFSTILIPLMLFTIPIWGFVKKINVYEVFIDGAKDGFKIAVRIIPYLVAIMVAIGMFRASGAMEIFVRIFSPITSLIGMPAEVLPVAIMRPLSGSGTLGIITELLKSFGPDSFIGRLASIMFGSTETTFYVLAVYFGSVGIRKTRHAVASGLVGDFTGIVMAVLFCRFLFG
ncbi:MAG: spore maturation protein [Candidatus Marinimicrobia bacterium]|nr:spore maturation protein [Candidatus Neomarinimicrobiota bacterium]